MRERGAHWVDPVLVAEVGFADDKAATDVVREEPPTTDTNARGQARTTTDGPHQPGGDPNTDTDEIPATATWAAPTGDELAALDELGAKGRWSIAGREWL
ncbi:MAG: hypothetical protein QOI10_3911 [Solirubrobacterales bacterium]|nr:hypothetical protein [Solirubrobacterales bacterium]